MGEQLMAILVFIVMPVLPGILLVLFADPR